MRIHDIIATCLASLPYEGDQGAKNRFWSYFRRNWELSPYHLHRSLFLHKRLIIEGHDPKAPAPSLQSYLCLLIGREAFSTTGLASLAAQPLLAHLTDRAAAASIVEAIEGCWLDSREGAKSSILQEAVARITEALGYQMADDIRWDLIHHRGKFRRWARQHEMAEEDFRLVITNRPNAWSAHLQLARILAGSRTSDSSKHLRCIIQEFDSNEHNVPATVILAALGELGRKPNESLRKEILGTRMDIVRRAVSISRVEGFAQPYQMLGRIGRNLFYVQPMVLIHLVGEIAFPRASEASQEECFDLGECLKLVGKAYQEQNGDAASLRRWCERAMEYYARVRSPDGFRLTMQAECALLLEDYQLAEEILQRVMDSERQDHWWHRHAQALRALGDLPAARAAAERAISEMQDDTYKSAFLRTLSQIQADAGDPCCIQTIQTAQDLADEVKFRDQLGRELDSYRRKFSRNTA